MREEKMKEIQAYLDEFKILTKEELNDDTDKDLAFIKSKKWKFDLNNNETIIREEIIKGSGNGSASIILPLTSEGNVILTIQPRVFTEKGALIELPAGYIDKGEDAKNAASRELREETGYSFNDIIETSSYYQDQGCLRAKNHTFLATGCKKTYEQNLDKDEYIRYVECTYDEMLELASEGYICDANSLIAISASYKEVKNILENLEIDNVYAESACVSDEQEEMDN